MSTPLRVTIVINDLFRGGGQRIVADLVAGNGTSQFQYEVLYFNQPKRRTEAETLEAELLAAGASTKWVGGGSNIRNLRTLIKAVKTNRPAVLLAFLPYSCILGRIAGALMRVPMVSVQCNLPFTYPRFVRVLDWLTLPLSRAWIGTTSGIEAAYAGGEHAFYSDNAWDRGRRHFTLYGGVAVEKIAAAVARADEAAIRNEFGIPAQAPLLMMTARLISWKGHSDLIAAMQYLSGAHALLIGWGPLEKELKVQAAANGVTERVHFLGRRTDVYTLLGSVDCYVQAHQREADGSVWMGPNLSQIEACAAGVPSVSTAVPLIEELIEEGVTGRLAKLNDPQDLARAIRKILADPEAASACAAVAKARVQAQYSLEGAVAVYEALLRRVACERA